MSINVRSRIIRIGLIVYSLVFAIIVGRDIVTLVRRPHIASSPIPTLDTARLIRVNQTLEKRSHEASSAAEIILPSVFGKFEPFSK